MSNLGDIVRANYRDAFAQGVSGGQIRPFVLPFSILGPFIVPTFWLAIPHTKRPWLYETRWLVVAFVLAFDINIIRSQSSSNVACAYGCGLMALWGIMLTLHLLVWTRPQFEAARAVKVVRGETKKSNGKPNGQNGGLRENGLRQRRTEESTAASASKHVNEEHEWVWQPFPEDAPFSQRLNWAFDLITGFRGIGWNWSSTAVPRPEIPAIIRPGDPIVLESIPRVSRSGFKRSLTESEFLWTRIRTVGIMYFLLDFLSVFMMKDPFFIFGPDHNYQLPSHLESLPAWLLLLYREIFSLLGIYGAIEAIFNLHDISQYYLWSSLFPARGELWQYTNIFGSFSQVLDRGLAGWWGSWWHQTFRLQFIAPSTYLIKHGYLTRGSFPAQVVTLYVSFIQSGLLHASGSRSSMPETKVWRAPAFFLLQATGILVQVGLTQILKNSLPSVPRTFSRAFNLLFTLVWLQQTSVFFVDDIASTGLWLLEPVPISPLRWMGFGYPNDHWWRWTREQFPVWYSGGGWWETGIAL
ncbi:Fc.00g063820.m01.CDS01 [Cosmosporella sp. VM-42]